MRTIQEKYNAVTDLLNEIRQDSFHNAANVSDAQAMGILVSQYLLHPRQIAMASAYALEDANAHSLAGELFQWVKGYKK